MEIRELKVANVLVLAPDGSITATEEISAIDTKLVTSLKEGRRLLVLDCSAVGRLTSPAIRALLLTSRKLERMKGRLVLCGMSAKLRQAFSISGFDKDFAIVATREEALQRVLDPLPPPLERVARSEPERPATDPRDAIAAVLLEALGVTGASHLAGSSGRTTRMDLDALASGLLAALRVG